MRISSCLLLWSFLFVFSSRRRHTSFDCDWSSDVCSSDLEAGQAVVVEHLKSGLQHPLTRAGPARDRLPGIGGGVPGGRRGGARASRGGRDHGALTTFSGTASHCLTSIETLS